MPRRDPDGVRFLAAAWTGVLLGRALPDVAVPALLSAMALAVVLAVTGRHRPRFALPVVALLLAATAVGALHGQADRRAVLPGLVERAPLVTVDATVAAEPRPLEHGRAAVDLTVTTITVDDPAAPPPRSWTTRERATAFLPVSDDRPAPGACRPAAPGCDRVSATPAPPPAGRAGDRLALGDQVRLRGVPLPPGHPLPHRPPVVLQRAQVLHHDPATAWPLTASDGLRRRLRETAVATLPPDRAALLVGMATGDTSLFDEETTAAFRAAGLTHLVAVSGANVAVVLALGLALPVRLGAGRWSVALLGAGLVAAFALVTRYEPSVLRAGVAALFLLAGLALRRAPGGRRALCLAATVLLLVTPRLALTAGFVLSVAATAGILWLAAPLATRLPRALPRRVRQAVAVTLAAQAGALPLVTLVTGHAGLVAPLANLLAVPLAAPAMTLGLTATLAAPLVPPLAVLAARTAEPFLAALLAVARLTAALPGAGWQLTGPGRWAPLLVLAAILLTAASTARAARH